jgi:fructose-1,6-bisphosphatase II
MNSANEHLSRNLGLDLVRVTEAAALAAGRWMGFGDPASANQAAAEAMAEALNTLDMRGVIVIGEEFKVGDQFALATGKVVGNDAGEEMDLVLDAIDGVRILARSHSDAISVIAATPRGAMLSLFPANYVEKIIVDQEAAGALVPECLDAPAGWTLALVARVKKKSVRDLVVFVLDRPRHQALIQEIRAAGARVLLRSDGDVAGALAALTHAGADLVMGTGGAPEGLIAACAVKSLGGGMICRLAPQSEEERVRVEAAGLDIRRIYTCDDLVSGDEIFFAATGITDGAVLSGVHYLGNEGRTESLVLRCQTGSRRVIQSVHRLVEKS